MRRTTTRPEHTVIRLAGALALIAVLFAAPACGRKGVPQPPVKVRPQGSPNLTSTQNGNTLTLSWALPRQNTDESDLVGISRVELFRYTELLEPEKDDEEEAPANYDVLDQVTQSFLAESAEEEGMYGSGYGTGSMAGLDDTFAGKFGGGGSGGSNTGSLGGSSRSSSSRRDDDRDGWAESQRQRPPRTTPGFRGVSGKFISARKFEKRADLLKTLTGAELQEQGETERLFHADPLPELDEETRELTRYHYAVRVTDTLGREGLFSEFLPVAPLEPPAPPRALTAKSLETSIDLTWDGPPVDPWVRIAREAELAALEGMPQGTEAGAPVTPGEGNAPGGKTATGKTAKGRAARGKAVGGKMAAAGGKGTGTASADANEAADDVLQPPEDTVVPGWIIQPPATFGPASAPRLTALMPDPWPVGPRRPVPPYIAGYYVFRQLESVEGPPKVPKNARPLIEKKFSDQRFTFGETYRYIVRTVMVTEDGRVESESSEPVLITPADLYPPITPVNFTYVAANGEVTLIWTPNGEPDLQGYNLYRREGTAGAEGEFVQLNDEPIEEPRYRDATVRPGTWYSYRVDAVDDSEPANRSEMSEILQVMAR